MTRKVKAQREAYHGKKNRGLITQFVIFVIFRGIDIGASVAVLGNARTQSEEWRNLNLSLFNISQNLSSKVHALDDVGEVCRENSKWNLQQVDDAINKYQVILNLTVFFNVVSITTFVTHFAFWIATLKMTVQDPVTSDKDSRITRLTRNSLLSLLTAVIRDVPLSCLNTELLVLRTGRNGLVCIGCTFSQSCSSKSFVEESLTKARSLLYFSYSILLMNSLWKGVSGFYRLSRISKFDLHVIRAWASLVFGFLYCSATFTPALLVLMYRYFVIPGFDSPFIREAASRVVVIGSVLWIVGGIAAMCCPLLGAIRLTAD